MVWFTRCVGAGSASDGARIAFTGVGAGRADGDQRVGLGPGLCEHFLEYFDGLRAGNPVLLVDGKKRHPANPKGARPLLIRPYLVGGVGLIRSSVQDVDQFFDVTTKNDFGFDVGAGIMGFFTSNIGIRGDVRYFRTFRGTDENITGVALGNVNFWRGSVGLSLKF